MAKKKQLITIRDAAQAQNIMRDLKEIEISVTRAKNRADEQKKKIEQALAESTNDQIERRTLLMSSLEAYVRENVDTVLIDSRAVGTPFGTYGIRTNPAKVELTMKKTDDAIAAIKRLGKSFANFIRTKFEIDKAAVKAAYDRGDVSDRDLSKCGLAVTQTDTFYVDIDLQDLATCL